MMSANLDDLGSRTSVLSSLCNSHAGELLVDPLTGDVIFQSTGAGSTFNVQHFCYRAASATTATLFYVQQLAYRAVNTVVSWKDRKMYVSGTAYTTSQSAIRVVSIDATDPDDNPEAIVAQNTSANAMTIVGDTLFFVEVVSAGQLKFQTATLFSCKPAAPAPKPGQNPCDQRHATNLSVIPHAFADQFSSLQLVASGGGEGGSLLFSSRRGNSIATVLSTYTISSATWQPVWVSPFNSPVAIGGQPTDQLHFIDGTLSTFGSFAPIKASNSYNVPFEITGQFLPTRSLGNSQPYPANGASGGWGRNWVAGESHWFWASAVTRGPKPDALWAPCSGSFACTDARMAVFSADFEMRAPAPSQLLLLAPNFTGSVLAVDEDNKQVFYATRVPTRPGPSSRSQCGQVNPGADSLVSSKFTGKPGDEPKVVLAQPNGWCFGRSSPALDTKRGKLYYSLVDQYSMFMGTNHLAVLDLDTGRSTTMDWGFPRSTDHRILRLSDDGNTLWSWGCISNRGEGCTSRMFVIDVSATSPPTGNWSNGTLPSLSSQRLASGLQDFSVKGQHNRTSFVFVAYNRPSTARPVRGVYEGNYVPGDAATWLSLLQPVDVTNIDVDHSDADGGLLIAARPPDTTSLLTAPPIPGLLLLRAPLVGVGRGDGTALTPTVIPFPPFLPHVLRTSNIVQLAHQAPHRLLFAFGRANCISDEIWETDISSTATDAPTQLVSALLQPFGATMQSEPDGSGGVQLSWTKCASRVVFADVKVSAKVSAKVDYESLDYAWLDLPSDPNAHSVAASGPALRTVSRVGDSFIFALSTPTYSMSS